MEKANRRHVWSYSAGSHGVNRVRAFEHGAKGIFLEWYELTGELVRRRKRIALGHTDRERAEGQADELAVKLRKLATTTQGPTLEAVLQSYLREVTPSKGKSKRKHDARCAEMFKRFFGTAFDVRDFSVRERDRFLIERRAGRIAPEKSKPGRAVKDRVIAYDWKFLLSVMRWAMLGRIIERNPLDGITLSDEKSPDRPVLTTEQYEKLLEVAPRIHPLLPLLVVMAHESGHRGASIRHLRWSDVDLGRRTVRWRGEDDKEGFAHETPLSEDAHEALNRAWKARASLEDGWIFPAERVKDKPMPRERITRLFRNAADAAEIPTGKRYGWHSFRRKFATELKDATNLKDLAQLGGWKSTDTLVKCYIAPDVETQRTVLAQRKQLRAAGIK